MNALATLNVPALVIFAGLTISVAMLALTASGHFPREHRGAGVRSLPGAAILWGALATVGLGALAAVALAWKSLPGAVAIIVGGGALLMAPLLLQPFPDSFVNGRRGLLALAFVTIALVAITWKLAA